MNTHADTTHTLRTRFGTTLACLLGTAALGAALATPVSAQDVRTMKVRFDDLDVNHSAGAQALYRRLRFAAKTVCEGPDSYDAILRLAVKACIDKAIDRAVRDVDAPLLTSLRFGGTDVRLAKK